MRIALLSDIHGNLPALEAVVADIRGRGVDRIVNLGDSVSGPLMPRETAAFLMAQGWLSLSGNHERQLLAEGPAPRIPSDQYAFDRLDAPALAWLRTLPRDALADPEVFLCHGTPRSDVEYFLESLDGGVVRAASAGEVADRLGPLTSPVVACGHTHVPRCVRSARGQLIVNPGSVGCPAYDDEQPQWHVVETGAPDARYAILRKAPEGWSADLVAVPYDHRSMARLAQRNHRPEWAHALLTGYMPAPGG